MPSRTLCLARVAALALLAAGCAAGPSSGSATPDAGNRPTGASGLQGAEWVVEDIDGRGIVDRSRATINFGADGRIWGRASCNSYRAEYSVEGDRLTISRAITTRMACAPALMQQESRLLAILAGTLRVAVTADDVLTLRSADGATLRARRDRR